MMILIFWIQLASAQTQEQIQAGAYLARAAGCQDCHTRERGAPFAGGLKLDSPFGSFITPNITPDWRTGIGKWTLRNFRRAMRLGVSPSGSILYPAFPYAAYTKMSDTDIENIFHYLRSIDPVTQINPPNNLEFPFDQRWLLFFWQTLYFMNGAMAEVPDLSPEWNRGAYLVQAVLHCAECHTPRTSLGGLVTSQWMAGSDTSFHGRTPPNLTPDPETGLQWTKEQWIHFLSSGFTPKGREMTVEMALVIRETTGLTESDRAAVAAYMISLPKVKRKNGGE